MYPSVGGCRQLLSAVICSCPVLEQLLREVFDLILHDKEIVCRGCYAPFVFSVGEQEFFRKKGLTNEPKRCVKCRLLARHQREGTESPLNRVQCANCGAEAIVPFTPKGYRPVLCLDCLLSHRHSGDASDLSAGAGIDPA